MKVVVSPIRYIARVNNQDGSFIDYRFYARSKEEAKRTAQELYYHDTGNNPARIGIKPEKPRIKEVTHVNTQIVEVLTRLKQSLINKSYTDFIQMFIDFDGYDLIISPSVKSFMIKFNNFTVMIEYSNGVVSVNENEILYYSESFNRTYSIRNLCVDIFIAV